ncbi:MAG: SDR family oxidoreductase [Pseudomonadota bacterium]
MSQRVLVTAAGSGIGRAIAEAFLAQGDLVHVCDIDPAPLPAITAAFEGASTSVCDVGDVAQLAALYAQACAAMGGVDILINNAGIGGPRAALENFSLQDWQRCLDVNLTAPFTLMQHVVPGMKAQGGGCIINIVTTSVLTGLPQRAGYVASKAGLRGLTGNAARELGPDNIRVNGVFPGVIDNPRGHALIEKQAAEKRVSVSEAKESFLSYVSMRTMIDPREVAAMCVFLASPAAKHVTGQEICVDGNVEWEQ